MVPEVGGIPACTEADPSPVNRMTNRCKNITLPQTSFAGDNEPVHRGLLSNEQNYAKYY